MTSNKRARENAKRRQAAYERKQAELAAQRKERGRRTAIIAGAAVVVLVLVGVAIAFAAHRATTAATTPSPTPTDGATATATAEPSATPSPTATDEGVQLETGWQSSPAPPDPVHAGDRVWTAVLTTNQGPITISLDGVNAPQATAAFTKLAQANFYNNTDCHRIVTDDPYLVQCGDPTGTGTGRASFEFGPLENVPKDGVYRAGDVVMVRSKDDANSMSSQFQIIWKDSTLPTDSAGGYTVVGKVTDGLAIVEGVAQAGTITGDSDGWPAISLIITEVSVQ